MPRKLGRREFLKTVGAVGVVAVVAGGLEGCRPAPGAAQGATATSATTAATEAATSTVAATATTAATAAPTATKAATAAPTATTAPAASAASANSYVFFNSVESAFMEAAAARIVPKDDLGPGALEAGAPFYIDHQLAGGYGVFARHYVMGPWEVGTPQQGYQARYIPREIYRIGIAETNAYSMTANKKTFDQLTTDEQDTILKGLADGSTKLATMPSALFFSTLRNDMIEGFFCDPVYGGNQGKVGWKLVGFPGVPAGYKDAITKFNTPFTGPTLSMAEAESM